MYFTPINPDTKTELQFPKSISYGMLSDGIKEIEKEITSAKYRKDNQVADEYDYRDTMACDAAAIEAY